MTGENNINTIKGKQFKCKKITTYSREKKTEEKN